MTLLALFGRFFCLEDQFRKVVKTVEKTTKNNGCGDRQTIFRNAIVCITCPGIMPRSPDSPWKLYMFLFATNIFTLNLE